MNLQVSDWDSDYMSLVWDPPPDDGGSPIQHYLVSVKVANARWEQLAQTERTKFTAKALKSGQLYEFKVCAVSKGGVSKHSQATQPLVAKSRKEAPRITCKSGRSGKAKQEVTVTSGSRFQDQEVLKR